MNIKNQANKTWGGDSEPKPYEEPKIGGTRAHRGINAIFIPQAASGKQSQLVLDGSRWVTISSRKTGSSLHKEDCFP